MRLLHPNKINLVAACRMSMSEACLQYTCHELLNSLYVGCAAAADVGAFGDSQEYLTEFPEA